MKFPGVKVRKHVRRFAPYNQFNEGLKSNGILRSAEQIAMIEPHLSPLCKAVDELGKGVIVLTKDGQVVLATNRAKQWARRYFGPLSLRLPRAMEAWVRNQGTLVQRKGEVPQSREPLVVERGTRRLVVRLLPDLHHTVLLLEEQSTGLPPECLECLGLTRREAEVLDWVGKGKSSDEIGTILGRSGRTVSKHLEHIYRKLGVENRTAAATRCLDIISLQRPQETP
ncbi:MAG: LuxR C-terminal-related transcriptional regulator [Deltaproteobacteria bacterium]|nr:LuxR C-terminal-related transcriptional regulator [Deltaproteobacteria bacterium]